MGFYGNQWLNESLLSKFKRNRIIATVNEYIRLNKLDAAKDILLGNFIYPATADPEYYKLWEKIGIPEELRKNTEDENKIMDKVSGIVLIEARKVVDKYNKDTEQIYKLSKSRTFQFQVDKVLSNRYYENKKHIYIAYFEVFKESDKDREFMKLLMPMVNKIIADLKNNTKLKAIKEIKITNIYFDDEYTNVTVEYAINK